MRPIMLLLAIVLGCATLSGCGTAYVVAGTNPNFMEEFSAMQNRAREARAMQGPAEDYANSRPLNMQTHRVYDRSPKEVLAAVAETFSRDHSNSTIRVSQGIMTVDWTMTSPYAQAAYSMQTVVSAQQQMGTKNTRLVLRTSYYDRLAPQNDNYVPRLVEIDARLYNYVECYLYRNRDCR